MRRIALVDYGAGNLVSALHALTTVGAEVAVLEGPGGLAHADGLVVPGVGAARPAMERLRDQGLVDPIREWIAAGRPCLGICLGMQLLFEGSDEDDAETLGVLPGRTRRLTNAPTLPHIGWNQVVRTREHPLFDGIEPDADFYFVHSYAGEPPPGSAGVVLATTDHGDRFTSAVAVGELAGVQFH
ncbi:MAG: imidazole glycerol phosphate synthase subunit HisH, partial [Chloroflexi bacterium]|nr:imidazole glycerol phosphate synthase subunit HisH [Chloroflexota bacterium]